MPKKIAVLAVVILVILGGGALFALNQSSDTGRGPSSSDSTSESATPPSAGPQTATASDSACPTSDEPEITYANDTFSPACVTIKAGTPVRWKNTSDGEIQIGIDPHPAHTGNKEVSNDGYTLNLDGGATTTSTLKTKGEFNYHDHLNPSATGTIIVQ